MMVRLSWSRKEDEGEEEVEGRKIKKANETWLVLDGEG